MRKEYVIFIILLGALLPAGCAENGAVEPEPSVSPVETPVETPVLPAGTVETPENTSDQIPSENLTRTEPENLSETPVGMPDTQAEARVVEVKIENFTFNPESVTISTNDTVRWTNLDPITHTVTGPDFTSGALRDGDSFELSFTKKGVYRYYCSIHPSMEGVVTVEG
ncbi:MAG: plastocyanin/azurin family copper-binding protein [Methanosarcina mazei]|uniref:cupredoxin domain-containing protein n=1 Tax=Methanosarcina soligelidi TaxID=1036677 RepID=UPI00064E599D|nr:cupredoxin family copper-binding protein [Methanosarcina soligelidi]